MPAFKIYERRKIKEGIIEGFAQCKVSKGRRKTSKGRIKCVSKGNVSDVARKKREGIYKGWFIAGIEEIQMGQGCRECWC